ncbi:MAG: SGNH/GDSL hydrolase family protein [Elusimicrobia bacterium]|nr:SGNH/GDSL hydrolase family protein [Elusimicrobiota bacterium]
MRKNTARGAPRRGWLVVALSSIFCFSGAELLLGILYRRNLEQLRFDASDLYYYYDQNGHRRHIPGKIGYERMWNDQGKAEFRINSLGFRGPEISLEKRPGVKRILFIGDSITLGGRLPEEETFVWRVGHALGPSFEVLNAGVGDVGLIEQEATLRESLKLKPDLVLLCWFLNDGRPPAGFPDEIVFKNKLIGWFNRQAWLKKSHLAGFFYERLRSTLVKRQAESMALENQRFAWVRPYQAGYWVKDEAAFRELVDSARFDWGDAWNEQSLARSAARIVSMRDSARRAGSRFALFALPVHAQVYAETDTKLAQRPQRYMAEVAAGADIPFLDLLPSLRRERGRPLFYDHCHYTPPGNGVVADEITELIRRLEKGA